MTAMETRAGILNNLRTGAKTGIQLEKMLKLSREDNIYRQLNLLVAAKLIKATGKRGDRVYSLTKKSSVVAKTQRIEKNVAKQISGVTESVYDKKIDDLQVENNLLRQTIYLAMNHMRAGQSEHAKAVLATMTGSLPLR